MNLVMDSSALIAYLQGEPGGKLVDELLLDEGNDCFTHAINLCEVFYDTVRRADEEKALASLDRLAEAGLLVREDLDPAIWQDAGRMKARLARISLADCFCAALARRLDAEVVTSDHREFDAVANNGLCKVMFIR